jgi:predicted Zn-dependent peptidase
MLGRVRSLDEVTAAINNVSPKTIAEFYEQYPPHNFTVVTLGPRQLQVSS